MELVTAKMNQKYEATKSLEGKFEQFHSSSIHNLEVQVGQLMNSLSTRNQETLPSNTENNPKEHIKAITLRSGTELQPPKQKVNT